MSTDYNVYVGPYLKVGEINQEESVEKEIKTCSNTDCEEHGNKSKEKFCPNCGSEIKLLVVVKKRKKEVRDIVDDLGIYVDFFNIADISGKNDSVQVYNLSSYYYDERYEDFEEEITEGTIDKETKKFRNTEEVKKMVGYFKKNGIKYDIRYGVVGYGN